MDKYEYQLKTEHIRQVAARKEYGEAAKLCDTIDWTKIRDVKMLTLAADVYTAVGEYEKAIDILQQAYEYAAMGRRIVYRLTELALKADSYDDAKNYLSTITEELAVANSFIFTDNNSIYDTEKDNQTDRLTA